MIVENLLRETSNKKIFTVTFEKKDGSIRKMNAMRGVRKGVKGVGGVRATTSKFKSTNNKGKMWKQNAPQSEFKFKIGKKNNYPCSH